MNKYILLVLISTLYFNCKNESSDLDNFTSDGETKMASYTFCSITPSEVEYSYRIGHWTFKYPNGFKIAEGKYDISTITVDSLGGCSYSYISSSINIEKWKFWNKKGQEIEPTKRMINLVQPNQRESENPFDQNQ
ncbi:hypothetical protein [Winogradskyella schleiferi]|uniref:hypothetical protein n=1 Tax=Winogradskyella schleiferi TaxID=2686078 RepID=UPI0015BEFB28|nr:hypothetical protein [Winogradskyella schleiferi]